MRTSRRSLNCRLNTRRLRSRSSSRDRLDTVAVAKSLTFGLSFVLDDIENTIALVTYQTALGSGAGAALFSRTCGDHSPSTSRRQSRTPRSACGRAAQRSPCAVGAGVDTNAARLVEPTSIGCASCHSSSAGWIATTDRAPTSGRCLARTRLWPAVGRQRSAPRARHAEYVLSDSPDGRRFGHDGQRICRRAVRDRRPEPLHGVGATVSPLDVTDVYASSWFRTRRRRADSARSTRATANR